MAKPVLLCHVLDLRGYATRRVKYNDTPTRVLCSYSRKYWLSRSRLVEEVYAAPTNHRLNSLPRLRVFSTPQHLLQLRTIVIHVVPIIS